MVGQVFDPMLIRYDDEEKESTISPISRYNDTYREKMKKI